MRTRIATIGFALAALLAADMDRASAQISGRVIFREGPIGVDIVFGDRPAVVVAGRGAPRGPVVVDRRPARYEPGMSLVELERYRAWIEAEYRTFKRMDEDEAWYRLGWTEDQLDDYVDWLKDERRFLKKERNRLRKIIREQRRHGGFLPGYDWNDYDGRERAGWDDDDWEDAWEEWEDEWEDRQDDWEDEWEDRRDDREDRWDDDDDDDRDDDRRRRGRRGGRRG